MSYGILRALMSKQQYQWLAVMAMMAARRTDSETDQEEGTRLILRNIIAQAGTFENAPTKSANDLTAALFILLLVWWWNCAKNRAKLVNPSAVSRKLTRGRFLEAIPADPAWLLASAWFWSRLTLCHFDHLPTLSRRERVFYQR